MQKNYYAIIPANVRYDKKLTANAKLLYGEITALCNEKGYCWATNDYFASLYGVSKVSTSKWIKQLIDQGYIFSTIEYREGTKEILNRYLRIVYEPIKENFNTPIKEKFKDNNTIINNTINTIYIYSSVVCYLNEKADTKYKATSKKTQQLIKARENEGFILEDFKKVIDNKVAEWLGTDMEKYLRPETLFSPKFESYLNQKGDKSNGRNRNPGRNNYTFKSSAGTEITEEERKRAEEELI